MKDLYELLNDVPVQVNKEDEVSVSEFEKKKLLSDVKKQIRTKKKRTWKRSVLASVMAVSVLTTSVIGLSFTTYAKEVPFLNNIFQLFNQDWQYSGYEEQSTVLQLTQESNGIIMTIEKAVFDGKTLFISYMLETELDLGYEPDIVENPSLGKFSVDGPHHITKDGNNKYVGLFKGSYNGHSIKEAHFKWDIQNISTTKYPQYPGDGILYEGDWSFSFTLPKIDTKDIKFDAQSTNEDFTFLAYKLSLTPISAVLNFSTTIPDDIITTWDFIFPLVTAIDNLGNEYKPIHQTHSGRSKIFSSVTFEQLHPDAKTLTIIPVIDLWEADIIGTNANGKPIKADYRSIDSNGAEDIITFEPIVIQIK